MGLMGKLGGTNRLTRLLGELISPVMMQVELAKAGDAIRKDATQHAPREDGDLESAITFIPGTKHRTLSSGFVGVPGSSDAIDQAWATEYGTWNYSVPGPEHPKTRWPAKSKQGATMPWLRPAVLRQRRAIYAMWRRDVAAHIRRRG